MAADQDGSVWFTASLPAIVGRVSTSGQITEYAIPTEAENLSGIVVGDQYIWFGLWSNPGGPEPLNRIGRMSRTGEECQEFIVPASIHGPAYLHNPHYLVLGPDGNVWFTVGQDALGRISTACEIMLFYLPPERCPSFGLPQYGNPFGLTVGPDNAMWLAAETSFAIMRFDLVTEQFRVLPLDGQGNNTGHVTASALTKANTLSARDG